MSDIKRDDLKQVSYNKFGKTMDLVVERIRKYQQDTEVAFDVVVPLLRSGMVPATHILSKLNLKTVLPVYYMYLNKQIVKRIEIPEILLDTVSNNPNILLVDANLSTGTTVHNAIKDLKLKYPNASFYIAVT